MSATSIHDAIDAHAAECGLARLELALQRVQDVRHQLAVAAAISDACDMTAEMEGALKDLEGDIRGHMRLIEHKLSAFLEPDMTDAKLSSWHLAKAL